MTMTKKHTFIKVLLLTLLSLYTLCSGAFTVRNYTNKNGLTNSFIFTMWQNVDGSLWIGTYDGLNVFNGVEYLSYPFYSYTHKLPGNLVTKITKAEEDNIWVQTNYGLSLINTKEYTGKTYPEFIDKTRIAQRSDHSTFILSNKGILHWLPAGKTGIKKVAIPTVDFNTVQEIVIDSKDNLYIFTTDGTCPTYKTRVENDEIILEPVTLFTHIYSLERVWKTAGGHILFMDNKQDLYEYNLDTQTKIFIANLKAAVQEKGFISCMLKNGNDYYIGFGTHGLSILTYQPDSVEKYQLKDTEIITGIMCLMKDRYQDIIWVGTDGMGIYMCYNEQYSIKSIPKEMAHNQFNKPIRALYYDHQQKLWIGSKGSGIMQVPDFNIQTPNFSTEHISCLTTGNSKLTDNSVYCFTRYGDLLWIGTELGVNYYSYKTGKLEELSIKADGRTVRWVHSINVQNDTTLWISTVGEGIVKVILKKGDQSHPIVKSAKRKVILDGTVAQNYFFASHQENDSIIWFGNRGYGAYRLNMNEDISEKGMNQQFYDTLSDNRMVNDIFSIHSNPSGIWLGTSSGLVHLTNKGIHLNNDGALPSTTIHGILEDANKNLWLSTNQGLVRFNQENKVCQMYNYNNGMEVFEFCDGAAYQDPQNNALFFGGTNGFVIVTPQKYASQKYMPPIHLTGINIFGENHNLNNFSDPEKGEDVIRLNYDLNYFQLKFLAIDYIDGKAYTFHYRLDEANPNWMNNQGSSYIMLSNLKPGKHTMYIKYRNENTGEESSVKELTIIITPPWWRSTMAYIVYILLFITFCAGIVYWSIWKYRQKKIRLTRSLERQQKEELYEAKLRFFTNITHEFCSPLTLIYGPCEKILSYSGCDNYLRKYAQLIQHNTERLNNLILELLEFRKLETGHKKLVIQQLSISDQLQDIADTYKELAERKLMKYKLEIDPDIIWNSDSSCISKIVQNLISNSFKYTPVGGDIRVEAKVENERLILRFSNSGPGIPAKDLDKIFDRYNVLATAQTDRKHPRTGLGLAICKNMVSLLQGDIKVDSIPGEITTFTISLPKLPLPEGNVDQQLVLQEKPVTVIEERIENSAANNQAVPAFDAKRPTIMVVDDDSEMLWFVSEIFTHKFNVLRFSNARDALQSLGHQLPALIISDIMMPEIDGYSFTQKIKKDQLWNHIPVVLLSAMHYENNLIKGLNTGADAYVTKPFNVNYLEAVVTRLLQRSDDLEKYHHSAIKSLSVSNNTYIHKEDQDFWRNVIEVMEKNYTNPELSVELLSHEMNCSTRQFYRRLKQITDKSPAEVIRECRLNKAEQLLTEEKNITIEEVMYQTGFSNRSTFYKLFNQRYGVTPKQFQAQQTGIIEELKLQQPD